MNTLTITKAAPTSRPVEDLQITFTDSPPDDVDLRKAADFYEAEATALAEALWNVLPGGTTDRLIGQLLERRASLFAIPFAEGDVPGPRSR